MSACERFVSEPLVPLDATFTIAAMANGEPGLPRRMQWRDGEFEVAEILRSWRDTGSCRHGSGERYVRKHWYQVRTQSGETMRIYFDRQPRGPRGASRWWLYSIVDE